VLEPPETAAQRMLKDILANPDTPKEVRSAPRHRLLSILVGREVDRYESILPGKSLAWEFPAAAADVPTGVVARIRFSTQFNMRASLSGQVAFGPWSASVSNNTQSVLEIPLAAAQGRRDRPAAEAPKLDFRNTGRSTVMLRPRRDVEVLTPADSFGMNMLRATCEMLCVVTFLCAFGLFLSSALSRPVATFTAFVLLAVMEMAPSVVSQFPDALDVPATDLLGLQISRAVAFATSSVSAPQPVSDLATGTCIEWSALGHAALVDALAAPAGLLTLAALLVRRRASAQRA
jgi:hypothetical protein